MAGLTPYQFFMTLTTQTRKKMFGMQTRNEESIKSGGLVPGGFVRVKAESKFAWHSFAARLES